MLHLLIQFFIFRLYFNSIASNKPYFLRTSYKYTFLALWYHRFQVTPTCLSPSTRSKACLTLDPAFKILLFPLSMEYEVSLKVFIRRFLKWNATHSCKTQLNYCLNFIEDYKISVLKYSKVVVTPYTSIQTIAMVPE